MKILKIKQILVLFTIITMSGCSGVGTKSSLDKDKPEYTGIAKELKPYYDEYVFLAKKDHINFDKKITMGFRIIDSDGIIGLCHWGDNFREIDIDKGYWNMAPEELREILLFHEMTHCLCGREHDWGKGKYYHDAFLQSILGNFGRRIAKEFFDGYLLDGCPKSIMNPYIVDIDCAQRHMDFYKKEMFERCDPW